MGAILSFLSGSVFRLIWSGVSGWIDKQQDHRHELARLELQGKLDADQHSRNMEALRVQAEMGIKTVQVQGAVDVEKLEAAGFYDVVKEATKPTGIRIVDAWNGVIRPMAATIAIILWVGALREAGFVMSAWDKELVGVILGFFFASRVLSKDGK